MPNSLDQDRLLSCKAVLRQRTTSAVLSAVVCVTALVVCSNTADMNVGFLMYFICAVAFVFLLVFLDQIVTIKHHIKYLSPLSRQDTDILARSSAAYSEERRGEGA